MGRPRTESRDPYVAPPTDMLIVIDRDQANMTLFAKTPAATEWLREYALDEGNPDRMVTAASVVMHAKFRETVCLGLHATGVRYAIEYAGGREAHRQESTWGLRR